MSGRFEWATTDPRGGPIAGGGALTAGLCERDGMLPDGSTARPHIVLITCHDLGRHLGCYGVPTVHSPHLDALAAQGAPCTGVFCAAPQCSPSRATIATGRYPHSNGVLGLAHGAFAWDLNPDERHGAALLGARGYATHLFGLQHVTPHAERLGFDRIHERGLGPAVAAQVAAFLRGPLPDAPLYLEINLEERERKRR